MSVPPNAAGPGKNVRTINEHLVNIYDEGELVREPTIRNFRIVRMEGCRLLLPTPPGWGGVNAWPPVTDSSGVRKCGPREKGIG